MKRDELDPVLRAVSDTLDELLWRHFEVASSWSHPESFVGWLRERGYEVTAATAAADAGGHVQADSEGTA